MTDLCLLENYLFLDDESRVVLKDGGKDFINASYIEVCKKISNYNALEGIFYKVLILSQ